MNLLDIWSKGNLFSLQLPLVFTSKYGVIKSSQKIFPEKSFQLTRFGARGMTQGAEVHAHAHKYILYT